MSRSETDAGRWIPEMYDDERRASNAPDLEEILAFLDGELDEEAADAFRDRLAIFPEAARLAAELADPAVADADDSLPVPNVDSVRDVLVAEGILESNEPSTDAAETQTTAEVVPIDRRQSTRSTSTDLWRWAAVVLLAANVGLAGLLLRPDNGNSAPSTDIATWPVESDQRLQRNARQPVTVVADSAAEHVLRLTLGDRRGFTEFRLVLEDAAEAVYWHGLAEPQPDGTFALRATADYLLPGAYTLRLYGLDGDQAETLATYPFIWKQSQPTTP